MIPGLWGFGYPYYFGYWPLWMQYWWLYNNDLRYNTSVAMQYLQAQQISQEEQALLQQQAQAMQSQAQAPQAVIDAETINEYVALLQNQSTPDAEIEQFFQRKGLTDDQILILQQQAVTQMEGMDASGGGAPAGPAMAPGVQVKYCSQCGAQLPPNARFCEACGAKV
jgi:ribosomal protein L40E